MRRPWCAGELATAWKQKVPIIPVAAPDYELPDEETLQAWTRPGAGLWAPEELQPLLDFGLDLEAIRGCYRHLRTLDRVDLLRVLRRSEDLDLARKAATEVLRRAKIELRGDALLARRLLGAEKPQARTIGTSLEEEKIGNHCV